MRQMAWLGLGAGLFASAAMAQGIDCGKARSPTERAICASPPLMALDRQVAAAYADALARRPDRRDATRQDLLGWLRRRDAACALPAAAVTECLAGQLSQRLAALAAPAPPPEHAPPAAATAAAPPPATPPPATPPSVGPPAVASAAAAQPGAAEAAVPEQAVPSVALPVAAATLDDTALPAAEEADTLLHVTGPGRFVLAAHGSGGAALQLVDMLEGPSEVAGASGAQDGRLDRLLDVGVYRLRVFSAPGAAGTTTLSVTAFRDAAPPRALPQPGATLDATLGDAGQRAFWLSVPPSGEVRVEAAGRALADLRLWRDGRELAALAPARRRIEPVVGHPLADLRLSGTVEPGTYLAVAYGGPPARWTDNDREQPLHVRGGASPALAEGWVRGQVGAFGSEVYAVPAAAGLLRLALPASAPATLQAGANTASLARTSREPAVALPLDPARDTVAEVRAAAGQAFTLQALEQPAGRTASQPGTYWVSAVANGAGGDELPPGVLLERSEQPDRPPRIVASTLPRVGPLSGWHARFNLRGPATLLFQAAAGPVAIRTGGVDVEATRGRGAVELPADVYALSLSPRAGGQGSLDLVVAPPNAPPAPPTPALPADPVIPLGVQTIRPGQALSLSGVEGPGVALGLSARRVPVALAEGPLSASLAVGDTLTVPVQVAPGGTLSVSEVGAGPVAFAQRDTGPDGRTTVVVPIADHPRTVVLAWHRTATRPADIPAPPPPEDAAVLRAGTPVFFDLGHDARHGVTLEVAQGGLFRVETLGRMRTSGRLSTAFLPALGEGDANGIGSNMLIQAALRAGRYRVEVTAHDSSGHLGLLASPAPLLRGATLVPGGSVRATLPAGSGSAFPVEVASPGRFRLQVQGLGPAWQGRLEDAQGWPLAAPGVLDGLEQVLRAGTYRLLVRPDAVTRQVVARLEAVVAPAAILGHGPHPLAFGTTQHATWREPQGQDEPRTPDAWTFALAGAADVTLDLDAAMAGTLSRAGEEPPQGAGDAAAAIRVSRRFEGRLEAGRYRLEVASLGRNDRAEYQVALSSAQLQPDRPRPVSLPASIGFAIAAPRVVSLTSAGTTPVRAVLHDADGKVLARLGARTDDWNIALSRALPAGSYTLDLAAASPPDSAAPPSGDTPPEGADDSASDIPGQAAQSPPARTDGRRPDPDQAEAAPAADGDADPPGAEAADTPAAGAADTPAAEAADTPAAEAADTPSAGAADTAHDTAADQPGGTGTAASPADDAAAAPAADAASHAAENDTPAPQVTLRLALPAALDPVAAPAQAAILAGSGVHVLALAPPRPGQLLVAQAGAAAETVLAVERQDASGWQAVVSDQGAAPVVAVPAGDDPRPWRVRAWLVDGGTEPIRVAVRAVAADLQAPGQVTLAALDGLPGPLAVAHVRLDAAGIAAVDGPADASPAGGDAAAGGALLAGGWPDHALTPLAGGTALPQGRDLWLLDRAAGTLAVSALSPAPGQATALTVPAGLTATLPAVADAPGRITLWRADSGLGRPSLGAAMGSAPGSAIALAGSAVPLRDAAGDDPLRLSLTALALRAVPGATPRAPLHAMLPAGVALPVTLPPGVKQLQLDLAAGTAAIPGWHAPAGGTAWAADAPLSRSVSGDWTEVLLVNAGDAAAPVGLSWAALPDAPVLRPGGVLKRFFGAAGSFEVPVLGAPGARIASAGDARLSLVGADGGVSEGAALDASQPGRLVVAHGSGALAVWMEGAGAPPWPTVAAQATALPARVALAGPAMGFALAPDAPVLLHAATTAPVLLALAQPGRADAPALFAAGADIRRLVAGPAELRLYPPQDGPLSGSLALSAEPVVPIAEGLGEPVEVGPGGAAAFGFTLARAATVGIGLRADPDRVTARLLDASGRVLGEGVAQLARLAPGRYVLEAQVPAEAATTTLRPALVGLAPPGRGPPHDVVQGYLELAGLRPRASTPDGPAR